MVSPKSQSVAFLRGGQVWTSSLDGATTPLIQARGGVSADSLVWSPDGTKLAFVSDRGNHKFYRSLRFCRRRLSSIWTRAWITTGILSGRGDGKQIAFIRVFHTDGSEPNARSTSEPWAIRIANVADGTSKQIWRADPGPGSVFHEVVSENQLLWGAGGRIVFPWEKDGWQHLYSVSATGGAVAALTPGDFEVDNVSFTEDGKEAVFTSNQNDIDRRHVWRVGVGGGPARQVTTGEGLEWAPIAIAGGVAYLHSDVRRPARAAAKTGTSERDLAPETLPADFPADSLVAPQQVIYTSQPDGTAIHGQLFLPADMKVGEKRPALVFPAWRIAAANAVGLAFHGVLQQRVWNGQYLANQGYVVHLRLITGAASGMD